MKKNVVLIIINILLILLVVILIEFLSFILESNSEIKENPDRDNCKYIFGIKLFDKKYEEYLESNYFRNHILEKPKQRPIIIFGCSYAYGWLLNEEQAFAYKLSEVTQRSVYNQGIPSAGIQNMLYILERDEIYKNAQNPEYIIFVFIKDHIYRLYRPTWGVLEPILDLQYRIHNGKFQEEKSIFTYIKSFVFVRFILSSIANQRIHHYKYYDKNFDCMKMYFQESKKIIDKKYPNAKFVILKYNDQKTSWYNHTTRWDELKKEGIIVLDTLNLTNVDLSDNEYKITNDVHPNEKAWDLIVPTLVEELNL